MLKVLKPKLYFSHYSPPARGAYLVVKALGLDLEIKEVNVLTSDYITPELVKLNPQHTIPTLVDGEFCVWDSHAIAGYLVGKYATTDELYPKDPKQRAVVDQRLYFDTEWLFPKLFESLYPLLFQGKMTISNALRSNVQRLYRILEEFLKKSAWLAGNHLTIADLCCVSSISTLDYCIPVTKKECPRLNQFLEKCSKLPYYEEANQIGLDLLGQKIQECIVISYSNNYKKTLQ